MVKNPWGARVKPLDLGTNPNPLLEGAKYLPPKFYGNKKKSIDENNGEDIDDYHKKFSITEIW